MSLDASAHICLTVSNLLMSRVRFPSVLKSSVVFLKGLHWAPFSFSSTHTGTIRRPFVHPSVLPSIRPSVIVFSLSHLFRNYWSKIFETCPRCFLRGLVVHARKWFRSVDKYGRRQPCLIFTVIASPTPKPLKEFC